VLSNLLQAHDQQIVRPSVITLTSRLDFAAPLRAKGIPVASLNLSGWWKIPLAISKLRSIIGILKPDIIHTNLNAANLSGRIAGSMQGQKRILSGIHYPMNDPAKEHSLSRQLRGKMAVIQLFDGWTDRYARPIHIACSQHVADAAASVLKLPARRLRVIYNGMVVPPLRPYTPPDLSQGGPIALITVGRLIREKGHSDLLKAMPTLIASYPNITLSIVGAGPLYQDLQQQIAELGLQASVQLLGARSDVFDLLQRSDIFVFPSISEGLPLAPLEAMAYGVPLVAADIPALREIVDPDVHGILVPPHKPDQLAEGILKLLTTPGLAQSLRASGHQRIAQRFNIDTMARTMETLYSDLMTAAED
jgi:glycosyltransferase involved in cell wall biosynthesis